MTPTCPDIAPDAVFSAAQAIKILGVSHGKFYADVKRGSKGGGLDGRPRRDNGRLQFTGREMIRYWKG